MFASRLFLFSRTEEAQFLIVCICKLRTTQLCIVCICSMGIEACMRNLQDDAAKVAKGVKN